MLYIIGQMKGMFTSLIASNFSDSPSGNVSFKDELTTSLEDKQLSLDEATKLLERLENGEKLRYTKDSANILVNSLGVKGEANNKISWVNKKSLKKELKKIVENNNRIKNTIVQDAKNELLETKESINKKKNPFNRSIEYSKVNMKGEDITSLLVYLTNNGYDTKGTKSFGPGSLKALKDFQKDILGFKNPDGKMDLNGKTMKYIVRDMNDKLTHSEGNKKNGTEANELIKDFNVIDKYLGAFNKAYGGKGETFSRDNGIIMQLGRLFNIADNDAESLYSTLEEDEDFKVLLKDLDGNLDKKAFAKELGLKENSKKFKSGVNRTLIIALIGLVLSGGSSLVLELGAINYGENLQKGPKMNKILKTFAINVDMPEKMRDVLISKETTVSGIDGILDVLNNSNMEPANLKRFIKEVYQPNWFQDTFGIAEPDGYDEVEDLIEKFQKSDSTEDAKNIVKEIYKLTLVEYKKVEKEVAYHDLNNEKIDYGKVQHALGHLEEGSEPKEGNKSHFKIGTIEDGNGEKYGVDLGLFFGKVYIEIDGSRNIDDVDMDIISYSDLKKLSSDEQNELISKVLYNLKASESVIRENKILEQSEGINKIGEAAGRYGLLDAKHDAILGKKFDIEKARKREKEFDSILGIKELKEANKKEFYSVQSYSYSVDVNKLSEVGYTDKLVNKMKIETINGETSILSGVIRGVEQHYNIDVSPSDFIAAFQNAQKVLPTEKVLIASNTGVNSNQIFQGKLGEGNLFKININGTNVYFKDKCTNIVTVINDIPTTIESTNSIPLAYGFNTGHQNHWKSSNNVTSDTKPTTTRPGLTDGVPDTVTPLVD